MYKNYGDVNFFDLGCLVDADHSDTVFDIIVCYPLYDGLEYVYHYAECTVDITDSWIDKQAVMDFIGMDETDFDPIRYAIGCVDYYGDENFGGTDYYMGNTLSYEVICDILKHKMIANDHLNIVW